VTEALAKHINKKCRIRIDDQIIGDETLVEHDPPEGNSALQ
jgi:hypothetical protein